MRPEVSMVAQSVQLGSKPTRAMHQDKSIDSIISRPDPWALQVSTTIAQSQILRSPAPIVLSSKVALGCGLQIQDRKSNCYHSLTGFLHNIAPFVLPKYISQEITNSQWKRSFPLWIEAWLKFIKFAIFRFWISFFTKIHLGHLMDFPIWLKKNMTIFSNFL